MLWNSYYGCEVDWEYDSKYNTKVKQILSYENNFILGVKGSELIRDWFDTLIQMMSLPY